MRQRYPATGARNARVDLFVADLAAESRLELDLGTDTDIYLPRVDWFPDSRGIAVQRQSRDQKTLELMRFDALSGRGRVLLTERNEHWVPLHRELTFLRNSPQFIWASSRDGFQHLYLYGNDGNLIRQLTSGEYMVVGESPESAIRAVDERARRVYFIANRPSPIERQLFWVSLDAPGRAAARYRRGGLAQRRHVAGRSACGSTPFPTRTPRAARRCAPAAERCWRACSPTTSTTRIRMRAISTNTCAPEFGTIAAADGQTMHYKLLKPRDLVSRQAISGARRCLRRARRAARSNAWGSLFHQYLVQHGYVVFLLDNRGSGMRGVRFETALGLRMGNIEVQDQVKGVEFLRGLPFVDAKRIGMFGWSYGGYMTLMCLMQAPDAFAAGVAGAPVTDWALYDTHYTERYLSTPAGERRRLPREQRARIRRPAEAAVVAGARHGRRQRAVCEQHRAHEEAAGPAEAVRPDDLSRRQARPDSPERHGLACAREHRALLRSGIGAGPR